MGVSRCIGRVGALAVALGVGTAVAFPHTALADEGAAASSNGSVSTSSRESTSGATDTSDRESSGSPSKPAATRTPDSDDDQSAGPDDDEPDTEVEGEVEAPAEDGTESPSTPTTLPEPPLEVVDEDAAGDDDPGPAPAESPASPTPPRDSGSTPEPSSSTTEADRPPRVSESPSASRPSSTGVPVAAERTSPAAAVPVPSTGALAQPVSLVGALVSTVLAPLSDGAPAAPAQRPLLWVVLAWVRRELQRTFANSTPTTSPQSVTLTLDSDTAIGRPVAFDAEDADDDPLVYTVPPRGAVGGPTHGTVTVDQATGTFTYDPDDAYALIGGTDTFTYTVSDAAARRTFFGIPLSRSATSATGTVTVTLNPVHVAPGISGDTATTVEDRPVTIAVLDNDTDANGDALTVSGVTQGSSGTVTFTASGVTYTPNADFTGTDTFTYTATDGRSAGTATVTVTVTPVDDAPVAVGDSVTVAEDSGTTVIDVLANDIDVDGGPKVVTGVTPPAHGTVTAIGPSLSYTPAADFHGTDAFTYTLNDGSTATVNVIVTPVDDAPVAVSDAVTVAEDSGPTVIDVLANDTDIDAGPKTITAVTQPAKGSVVVTGTTVTYTPTADFHGTDTFTYTLNGGATATVTVTVTPVDDAPVAVGDTATVDEGGTTTIAVIGNDTDADGTIDTTTVVIVRQPTAGTATVNGDGTVTYVSDGSEVTSDSFTYTVKDTVGVTSNVATVSITVNPVNDAPVAVNDAYTVAEDGVLVISTPGVLANDSDPENDSFTIASATQPQHGAVNYLFSHGAFKYTPAAGFSGTDTFTYTLNGGSTATVTVTVTAVDDAPVAVNDAVTVAEDSGTTVIDVLANDTDIDGGPKTITAITQPTSGTTTITATGVAYIPNENFHGTDTFTYTLNGGTTAEVTVTVTPVNDAPVAPDKVVTISEDTRSVAIHLTDGATDVDGDALWRGYVTYPAIGDTFVDSDNLGVQRLLRYYPPANYTGQITIPYTVWDGQVFSNWATITINVTPVNDAPVAVNDSAAVEAGGTTTITLTANDTDVDTDNTVDPATIVIGTPPSAGTVTVNSDGTVTYTSTGTTTTTDTFTYTVKDTTGAVSNPATVTVTVTAINTAPVIGQVTTTPGIGNTWVVSVSADDAQNDALTTTVASADPTVPLTVTKQNDGTFRVIADPTWARTHPAAQIAVTVTVTDTQGLSATTTSTIGTANNVTALGLNFGQLNLPTLPAGTTYTQVAASTFHTVLLRSDGIALAIGSNTSGQLNIPELAPGVSYTQIAVGAVHTVLLRSDGTAVAIGNSNWGKLNIPQPPSGVAYTQIAAGTYHTVLLRSDGTAVGVGDGHFGALNIPALPANVRYTQVAAGHTHTVLLRSDGAAVAVGDNADGQLNIPSPPAGVTYTQIAAGYRHTVLLRSDGTAVAVGNNSEGQLNIPASPTGTRYTQIAAGDDHTVLLRSDGTAVAIGNSSYGQLNIPQTGEGVTYTRVFAGGYSTLLISSATVIPINTPPVAMNDTVTVAEGGTATIAVTANDTDADGTIDTATVVITRQPTAGSVTVNAGGTVTYVSNGSEVTADSFAYRINDNTGATSNEATVFITVTPVNDAPVAADDAATVAEGGTTTIAVIANDTDADGGIDTATVIIVTQPTAGTATANPDGTVTYVSDGSEVTSDSFTYTVEDGTGAVSNVATVSLTITPVDDAPVAVDDAYTVAKNGVLVISAPGLLANDFDPEGNSFTIVAATGTQHGTVDPLYNNGSFTYRPAAGYSGTDTFTYTISDGTSTAQATVIITVSAVDNQTPVAVADSYTVAEDGTLNVTGPGVLANDTDADGDPLSVVAAGPTSHGTFTLRSDGSFTYTPVANFHGTDSFTYQVSDGSGPSMPATVTITVTPVNDAPVVQNDTIPFPKDGFIGFSLANRSSDVDGDTLTATLISGTTHGTLFFDGTNRAFSYRPNTGFTGQDSFTYKVNDGTLDSAIATVTLNVS